MAGIGAGTLESDLAYCLPVIADLLARRFSCRWWSLPTWRRACYKELPSSWLAECETDPVRTILNLIWLVLSGFWLALAYAFAGLIMCVLVIVTA